MEPLAEQTSQLHQDKVALTFATTGGRMARLTGPSVIAARVPTGQSATVLRATAQPETGTNKATARPEPETVARARIAHRETGQSATVVSKAAV